MLDLPARKSLAALSDSANSIMPVVAVGFVREVEDGRASVLYSHAYGISRYLVSTADVPAALVPQPGAVRHADAVAIRSRSDSPIEWQLIASEVQGIVSAQVPDVEPCIRFWVGLSEARIPTDEESRALERVSLMSAGLLNESMSSAQSFERLQRLELAATLLPAIRDVLDVRDVFSRLSDISQVALPHDMLTLGVFSDDFTAMTAYALTGHGSDLGRVLPNPYPARVTQAWELDIIDDRTTYPFERDRPPVLAGMRSSLRVAIRSQGRVIGALAFHSAEPSRYTDVDLAIGCRLADHVAVALIHHRLAEEGRRAAALEERRSNLDLVDGLLTTITGVLDVREVFDRIFEISQRALPHDAMSLAVPSPDGTRVTLYARTGALRELPVPWEQPLQDTSLVHREWDHVRIDDLPADPVYAPLPSVKAGMRSLIIIPVRLEEQLRAWVNFWSATPGRFSDEDVPIARRIAAHVTLALSHQRLAEQARRNEELRAKSEKSELLDEVLASVTSAGELPVVFDRISNAVQKVLVHDALLLTALLPDRRHGKVYASKAPEGARFPDVLEVPPRVVADPNWAVDLVDDLQSDDNQSHLTVAALGYRAALRVAIRLDNEFVGALSFLSFTAGRYGPADILIAKRIADRVALSFARERGTALLKRADEATERAAKLEARVRALTEELDARTGYRRVVGESPQWREVLKHATQVAATETTVLLLGESGTGKEVVARFLHRGSSRNKGPVIALNCAALPEQLLEAELFGYERGAYTGATQSKPGQLEQAAGGTLFLDEVAEMSPSAQAKFLRVLQEREFQRLGGTRILRTDARVVAATNRDLQRAIANGQFREDLYYRLNVFAIRLPRLRDRPNDILPLSEAFLAEIGRGIGRPPAGISRDAKQLLVEYPWPGNVRELRNILERAAILCDGGLITAEHLALNVSASPAVLTPPPTAVETNRAAVGHAPTVPAHPASASDLETMERAMIQQALQNARFNKSKAAKALGLTRRQLYARMRKFDVD